MGKILYLTKRGGLNKYMGFFSNLAKNMLRGSILTKQLSLVWHLEQGGAITDEIAKKHLYELVQIAFKDPDIGKVVRHHNLSLDDVSVFIAAGVIELSPDAITLYGGSKLLAPVIILLDWTILDTAFAIIRKETISQNSVERRKSIINYSASCIKQVKQALDRAG